MRRARSRCLSRLDQIPAEDLRQIVIQGLILGRGDDVVGKVFIVRNVEQPSIGFEKDDGGSKAGALVALLEWVRPDYTHHQADRQRRHILHIVIMIELPWPVRGARQLVRFQDAERLAAGFNERCVQFLDLLGAEPNRLTSAHSPRRAMMRGKRAITRARPAPTSTGLPSGLAIGTVRSTGFSFDFALVAMLGNMQRRSLTIKERELR